MGRVRVLLVVLLAVVLGGCADTPVGHDAHGTADPDAGFVAMMIPHHAQALELTAMVPGRGASPAVDALALRIDRDQSEEIGQLQGLAAARGWAPVDEHVPMGGMGGMADPATLARLRTLQGAAFDALWRETMIRHHEGAVAMSRDYLAHGRDETLRRFAQVVIAAQSAEIDMMRAAA